MVKLDVDTLTTVPDLPLEAMPARGLPPAEPPPAPAADGGVAAAEDVPQAAERPISAHITTAAMIHPLLLFESNRRTPVRRSRLAVVTEADESGEEAGRGGGATPAPPELPATVGPDVALETGRSGTVSWGLVCLSLFIVACCFLGSQAQRCRRVS